MASIDAPITWPEQILRRHAPALVEHLGLSPREWKKLQVKADARLRDIEARMPEHGELTVAATLLDHATFAEVSRIQGSVRGRASVSFLRFIDAQLLQLIDRVPKTLLPRLRSQMCDLFINFSTNESKYKEKLAELLSINWLLQHLGAVLCRLEIPIPGRETTLDAEILLPTKQLLPVEILNIQLRDDRIEDEAGLMALIDRRVVKKTKDKLGKVITHASELDFPLQMVVWFQRAETFERYGPALASRGLNCPYELPICALQILGDGHERYVWRFGSIAALLQPH